MTITHRDVTKARLLALANEVPGAWEGLKIAALLLTVEGQRPGWITSVLGLTRMSLLYRPGSSGAKGRRSGYPVILERR